MTLDGTKLGAPVGKLTGAAIATFTGLIPVATDFCLVENVRLLVKVTRCQNGVAANGVDWLDKSVGSPLLSSHGKRIKELQPMPGRLVGVKLAALLLQVSTSWGLEFFGRLTAGGSQYTRD